MFVRMIRVGSMVPASRIEALEKEVKWYNFGPLSFLVCTLSGLLGWYVGEVDNLTKMCFAVVLAAVAYWMMSASMDFKKVKRKFSCFSSNVPCIILSLLVFLIYGTALLVSHHRHLH